MIWLLGVVLMGSTLIQGGFYPTVFLLAGAVAAVLLAVKPGRGPVRAEYALWCFAGVYLLTPLLNGYSASGLAQAALPLTAALFARCVLSLEAERRRKLLRLIVQISGVLAGIAMLALSGAIPIRGAVAANRLQFPFQYANAAGTWYAAMSLLALEHDDRDRWIHIPLLAALILTRSVGALGLYVVITVLRTAARNQRESWKDVALIHALGVLFAAALLLIHGLPAALVIILAYAASWKNDRLLSAAKKLKLHWVCVAAGAAGVVPMLLSGRVSSAVGTLAERLVQIRDGLTLASHHPLTGIGAGNWERVYPYYQSAQYTSAVVHSGLVQFAVDGGAIAVVCFLAFAILGLRTRGRSRGETCAALLLLLHSFLDFNLQYFPILALLAFLLLTGAEGAPCPAGRRGVGRRAICGLLAVPLVIMLYTKQTEQRLVKRAGAGDWPGVSEIWLSNRRILGDDPEAERIYGFALYSQGRYDEIPPLLEDPWGLKTDELTLISEAYAALGEEQRAFALLLDELERQPFNVDLFETAAGFLTEYHAPSESVERYNEIAGEANTHRSYLAGLMGDQIDINLLS